MQFFISHLASWLRTRRFSEPTFRPSGATNHSKKHSVSRLSYLFGHLDLLSSETFSLIFFLLLFSSLLFSDSSHFCFSSFHIVGNLTSKLPSVIQLFLFLFLKIIGTWLSAEKGRAKLEIVWENRWSFVNVWAVCNGVAGSSAQKRRRRREFPESDWNGLKVIGMDDPWNASCLGILHGFAKMAERISGQLSSFASHFFWSVHHPRLARGRAAADFNQGVAPKWFWTWHHHHD